MQALQNALRKYAGQVSQKKLQEILNGIQNGLSSVLNPQQSAGGATVGLNPATLRAAINDLLEQNNVEAISDQVDFMTRIATEVARGAGNYVRSNDQDVVDAYPAWELLRVYDRMVPRGFRVGPKGALIPVPSDAWPARWVAACKAAGDDAALKVFYSTGRMIALKDSGVWQALGDGAGGYEDTLGNSFAPFAYNSGFDTDDISYAECVQVGLIDAGYKPQPAKFSIADLFAPIEEAA